MLYSIIPPILVILSLAGIIIFLAKKAPQVANLNDEDDLDREELLSRAGFFQKSKMRLKISLRGVGHLFLGILEKITGGAKMIFTKLEGKFRNLNASVKNKRNREKGDQNSSNQAGIENNEDADIINKLYQYQPKERVVSEEAPAEKRKLGKKESSISDENEEKIIKPTVSDRVTRPRARVEMKDRLENLLIERIAANPKDTEAYERLGEYYMEIDSLIDAKECFKQVLKLDPKNGNVKYRMRRLEAMLHKR